MIAMLYNYINKMMRQSEFKKKYDPDTGRFQRKHIYGEGIRDKIRSLFGVKPIKKKSNTAPPSSSSKKAGDEIAKYLSQDNRRSRKKITPPPSKKSKKAGDEIAKYLSQDNQPSRRKPDRNDIALHIMTGTGKKKLI